MSLALVHGLWCIFKDGVERELYGLMFESGIIFDFLCHCYCIFRVRSKITQLVEDGLDCYIDSALLHSRFSPRLSCKPQTCGLQELLFQWTLGVTQKLHPDAYPEYLEYPEYPDSDWQGNNSR